MKKLEIQLDLLNSVELINGKKGGMKLSFLPGLQGCFLPSLAPAPGRLIVKAGLEVLVLRESASSACFLHSHSVKALPEPGREADSCVLLNKSGRGDRVSIVMSGGLG